MVATTDNSVTNFRIKAWVDKMQEDLVTLARTASGVDRLADIYLKNTDLYTVQANNPRQLVEIAARDIEKLLSNRSKALVFCEKLNIIRKLAVDCMYWIVCPNNFRSGSRYFHDYFGLLGRFFVTYLCDINQIYVTFEANLEDCKRLRDFMIRFGILNLERKQT
ncbi:hypothetical protein DUI87_13204 [Hirundo rustica rustica]|uniref:Uncharacterized protein n=1 Tax=Hirundo rustica rustica TaxID=333673 RepID=A0A3M0KB29_HIRRU|nr:hypothetical protein DUI87_13204 [Hirundo rustica rustica]